MGSIERAAQERDERRRRRRPGAALLPPSKPSDGRSGFRSIRTTGRIITLAGSELASI
jgi:hypothetical protein